MDKIMKKGPRTSDMLLFRLQNNLRKISLLVNDYVTKFDDVLWSCFGVIPKIALVDLCKIIDGIINHSTFIVFLNLESMEGKGKIYKKLNISRMKRVF